MSPMVNFIRLLLGILCLALLGSCSSYRHVDHVVSKGVGVPSRRYFHREKLVAHQHYCSAFSKKRLQPAWVAWTLTQNETTGEVRRSNNFAPDSKVRSRHRVEPRDYSYTGFDRGHLCPSADNRFDQQAMDECFYMTNMCPQTHTLNAGGWAALEDSCRKWAVREDSIVIVAGPIFFKKRPSTIGDVHKIAVPDAFFKVVLSLKPGEEKAIGFIFSNSNEKQTVADRACTVRDVEKATGFNFFPHLPKKQQKSLENNYNLPDWSARPHKRQAASAH